MEGADGEDFRRFFCGFEASDIRRRGGPRYFYCGNHLPGVGRACNYFTSDEVEHRGGRPPHEVVDGANPNQPIVIDGGANPDQPVVIDGGAIPDQAVVINVGANPIVQQEIIIRHNIRYQTKREYERQVADDEAQLILSFQAVVASQSNIVHELKEPAHRSMFQEEKSAGKKHPASRPLGMIIKVKPQAKKARVDKGNVEGASKVATASDIEKYKSSEPVELSNVEAVKHSEVAQTGLVSYSDDSDDDE